MYVKWKRETLRDKARSTVLRAQIVRSYRDKLSGRVCSEFIAYLATINEAHRSVPVAQEKFWREVDRKLSSLSLMPDDEQHLLEKLLKMVSRPRGWAEILAPYAFRMRKGRVAVRG
jgi:hypothetical protein